MKPTQYQIDQLRAMYEANVAELAQLLLMADARRAGARMSYPADRIRKLKKSVRAVERLEQKYGVTVADLTKKETA